MCQQFYKLYHIQYEVRQYKNFGAYASLVLALHDHLLNVSCPIITIYFSAVHIYKSMNYEWWLCSFIPWRLTKWKHNKTTIRIIKRFLLTWLIWEGGAVLYQNKKCQYYRGAPKVVTVSPGKKIDVVKLFAVWLFKPQVRSLTWRSLPFTDI